MMKDDQLLLREDNSDNDLKPYLNMRLETLAHTC